jgi:hypothetical protein
LKHFARKICFSLSAFYSKKGEGRVARLSLYRCTDFMVLEDNILKYSAAHHEDQKIKNLLEHFS